MSAEISSAATVAADAHGWWRDRPFSPAVRRGDLLFVGGQIPVDADGAVIAPGDVRGQSAHLLETLRATLAAAGGTLDDVVDLVTFHADVREIDAFVDVARGCFADDPPAWTGAGFVGSPIPGTLVALRAIAHLGDEPKRCLAPPAGSAMRALPFSAAVRKGPYVFLAGQSAADAHAPGEAPMDHCAQARLAYDRMRDVLAQLGASIDDVLDFSSFHRDIRGAIPTLEQIYMPEVMGELDTDLSATTSHIGATGLLRPDILGVYGALADVSPGGRYGATPDTIWWKGVYPIAGATMKREGRLITVAGQVASAPDGSIFAEGDVAGQARYILEEIRDALAGLGASMDDVVEVSSFHKDTRWFDEVLAVAQEFFPGAVKPTWTYTAIPGLWMEGYLHEISAIAVVEPRTA
jgi:enamine deaminase RidA (YjgF/YER057c/UK114 family)